MDRTKIEARIGELTVERASLSARLDAARVAARDGLIEGKKPASFGHLVEEVDAVDAALGELRDRLVQAHDADARRARVRTIERALEMTAERKERAAAVDASLSALHSAWASYTAAVQAGVGMVASAGGDVGPLRRVNLHGHRQSDGLVKAMVASSGMELVRALGVETNNRREHGVALAAAEERVALSLQAELLRVRAGSPQQHVAREAERELAEIEGRMSDPLEL